MEDALLPPEQEVARSNRAGRTNLFNNLRNFYPAPSFPCDQHVITGLYFSGLRFPCRRAPVVPILVNGGTKKSQMLEKKSGWRVRLRDFHIRQLRQTILDLAVQGEPVLQDRRSVLSTTPAGIRTGLAALPLSGATMGPA